MSADVLSQAQPNGYSGDSNLLVTTKLSMPRNHAGLVCRQRLLDKLGGDVRPLSLVCAPAGFGKTTLLISWLQQRDMPVAWLSLDDSDNDPAQFMRYLVAAIQTVEPGFAHDAAKILALPQAVNTITVLSKLLNEVDRFKHDLIVALDDYHVIHNAEIHEALNYLLDHLPAQLHIAITSRTMPPLVLPRLRVRRQLAEVFEEDLSFNDEEARLFLNEVSGLNLSTMEIAMLKERTEGWIAGLQLAALSLESEQDKQSFIRAFAGDDRYIIDYLTDEVLQRQPQEVKQFLLQTSVLDRLCGPLCDKLTGSTGSVERLAMLESLNMFIIPLDSKRRWYRYHHLFADLLRNQLVQQYPDSGQQLHRAASEWFSENNFPHEAVHHAFEVEDFEQVANVLAKHGQRLFEEGQIPTLMAWYKRLPESVYRADPCHALRYVWSHYLGCGEMLHELVEELQSSASAENAEIAEEQRVRIQIDLTLMGGFLALQKGDTEMAINYAEQTIQYCQVVDMYDALPPRLLLASAHLIDGGLEKARSLFSQIIEASYTNEFLITINAAVTGNALALSRQGRLREARTRITDDLARLQQKGWDQYLVDTAWVYLTLSGLLYQSNELDGSMKYLQLADEVAKNDKQNALPGMIETRRAKIFLARGEADSLHACIETIQNLDLKPAPLHYFPSVEDDMFALLLAQGDLHGAEQWLSRTSLQDYKNTPPKTENGSILLARLLLLQNKPEQALTLISTLLLDAQRGRRYERVIELFILQALARQAKTQTQQAIESLQRALASAADEHYVRLFVNEGAPMAALLKRSLNGPHADYAQYLLQQIRVEIDSQTATADQIEPLSAKEMKTLEHLIAGLSNKEIAEKLFVSPNTVKTHVKNIYRKMGVNNRLDAISKGKPLIISSGNCK